MPDPNDFSSGVGAALGGGAPSPGVPAPSGGAAQDIPDITIPLEAFDSSRANAVANAGFMPGQALPPQKALLQVREGTGDIEVSKDGTNLKLVHQFDIIKGTRTKKGSFFARFTLFGKTAATQQTMTNMLKGFAHSVGLEIPPQEALVAASKKNLGPLRTYAKQFEKRTFIGGINYNKMPDGEIRGNRLSGYDPATPEGIAALDKEIEATARRTQRVTTSPVSPLAG